MVRTVNDAFLDLRNELRQAGVAVFQLEARELIKLRVLENSDYTPREAAEEIAKATNSEVITVIGTKFVLYRESEKHKKIMLD